MKALPFFLAFSGEKGTCTKLHTFLKAIVLFPGPVLSILQTPLKTLNLNISHITCELTISFKHLYLIMKLYSKISVNSLNINQWITQSNL